MNTPYPTQPNSFQAVLREFQRTLLHLRRSDAACFDAAPLLHTVGQHLELQFPAEQQNDTKEFMDKLLDRLELELSDVSEPAAKNVVQTFFGATTAEIKV